MKKRNGQIAFKAGNTILYATPIPEEEARAANERIYAKTKNVGRECRRRRGLAAILSRNIVFT